MQYAASTAECPACNSVFYGLDRNEDGSPFIETRRCAHPGCEVYLCRDGCEHLSFFCEGCRSRFCGEHKVTLDGLELCADCAIRLVEDQEPECECSQSDADLFDARGYCEYHDPNSTWNVRLRAVTAVQMDEQERKGDRMSRNYEQHPETFPLSHSDYEPDLEGWKADAYAVLRATEPAVADSCQPRGRTGRTVRLHASGRADPVSRSTFQDDDWYLGVKQPLCCEGSRSQGGKQ
jgi:hypothetical protein